MLGFCCWSNLFVPVVRTKIKQQDEYTLAVTDCQEVPKDMPDPDEFALRVLSGFSSGFLQVLLSQNDDDHQLVLLKQAGVVHQAGKKRKTYNELSKMQSYITYEIGRYQYKHNKSRTSQNE